MIRFIAWLIIRAKQENEDFEKWSREWDEKYLRKEQ